ncbi:hypothetical protein LASUN_13450 [Lentilactobacillus sunkii]|jgi:hypothetical protein|uniref:Uncharacterized protein n=1 Tax=Lentilactobacillus sunkii TaxID=481719 RepID=A0A1E7XCF1_9LACO|nr:hypothetical protein [Lentilactobacillus sunkii]OFA10795.1 hypothetical protein LASUN_13450 [Lentilactobacillus sunkii]
MKITEEQISGDLIHRTIVEISPKDLHRIIKIQGDFLDPKESAEKIGTVLEDLFSKSLDDLNI